MTVIYCDYGFMEGKQAPPTLTIQEDGTYTNEEQANPTYNQAYLKSFVKHPIWSICPFCL